MNRAALVATTALLGGWIALGATPARAQEVDSFYARLVEDGIRSAGRGDPARASEELRIAAFGLMDAPDQLARALTHLALAQSASGNVEGFAGTLRRLADLESRFGAYVEADLDASTRAALGQAARSHLTAGELRGSPLLGPEPASSPPAPAGRTPTAQATLCISWTTGGDCRQPGTPAPKTITSAGSEAAPPSTGPSSEELERIDRLAELAASKVSARNLRSGFEEARALADRYPDWPEAQRAAGLLAARSASYPEAVIYFRRSGQPAEDEPLELFYLSVALFETDEVELAAETLRRALPRLEQNREIRRYVRKILPPEAQG